MAGICPMAAKIEFVQTYGTDSYTMERVKVFWRAFIPRITMALCLPFDDPNLGPKVPLTQDVVTFCPFQSTDEAFFFSACGNSSPATLLHAVSSTGKSFGRPHILGKISIPRFKRTDDLHTLLAELSHQCHDSAQNGREDTIVELEAQIDEVAARMWGISGAGLKAIQGALADM